MEQSEKNEIVTQASTAAVDAVKELFAGEREEMLKLQKSVVDVAEGFGKNLITAAGLINSGLTNEETTKAAIPLLDAAKAKARGQQLGLFKRFGAWAGLTKAYEPAKVSATKDEQIAGLAVVVGAVGPANVARMLMPSAAMLGEQEAETLGVAMSGLLAFGIEKAHDEKIVAKETKPMKTWQKLLVGGLVVAAAGGAGVGVAYGMEVGPWAKKGGSKAAK